VVKVRRWFFVLCSTCACGDDAGSAGAQTSDGDTSMPASSSSDDGSTSIVASSSASTTVMPADSSGGEATTDAAETTGTSDTGDVPGDSLYPPAPYDCTMGVPPPPFDWTFIAGVTSTEDIAFDTQGWLVSADYVQNLLRFAPDGTMEVFSPGAGESRGLDILPDRDIVFTNPDTGQIQRVGADSGAVSLYASDMPGTSGIDVAADGSLALGDLSGYVDVYDAATDELTDWGRVAFQLYGTVFSLDESRVFFASYSPSEPYIYMSERADDGSWPAPTIWTEFSTFSLAGLALDACGNIYAMDALNCTLWRFDESGQEELLVDLAIPEGYCPALAFGRGLGGWDAYKLYISTYDEVVEVDIGVPGRPR
jgi:hypothetical protein